MAKSKFHPMQIAEAKLVEIGVEHALVQGFTEGDGIEGRCVFLRDPPGTYYILGIDNRSPFSFENRIQVLFNQCPENAAQIAKQIGWHLEKVETLPVVDPLPEHAHIEGIVAAYFVPHAA